MPTHGTEAAWVSATLDMAPYIHSSLHDTLDNGRSRNAVSQVGNLPYTLRPVKHERDGPVSQMREHDRRDLEVVADHLGLGKPRLGAQDLLPIRHSEASPADLDGDRCGAGGWARRGGGRSGVDRGAMASNTSRSSRSPRQLLRPHPHRRPRRLIEIDGDESVVRTAFAA